MTDQSKLLHCSLFVNEQRLWESMQKLPLLKFGVSQNFHTYQQLYHIDKFYDLNPSTVSIFRGHLVFVLIYVLAVIFS